MFIRNICKRIIENELNNRIGKKEYQYFWEGLYLRCLCGMNIGGGSYTYDSGEENVLRYVKDIVASGNNTSVLFDVGANVGEYTKMLLKYFPDASIHSFEPARETYRILSKNICENNVLLNNFGLSDKVTQETLYYDAEGSGMASLYERQLDWKGMELSKSETVQLLTLDNYCEDHGIDSIDLLKMDVEGNEYKVLQGGSRMLSERRIKSIQMEFGGCNIDSRTYFRDFWNLLHKDYLFYRIVSDGMQPINEYRETLEIFTCTNFIIILNEIAEKNSV